MEEEDCFYGFREKAGILNKNKSFLRERATDAMDYDAEKLDTLYKHIPFYIRLSRGTKKAVGVFYHNSYDCVFDMGQEISGYWDRYCYYQTDGGDIDLFLINGPDIASVVDRYTFLYMNVCQTPARPPRTFFPRSFSHLKSASGSRPTKKFPARCVSWAKFTA